MLKKETEKPRPVLIVRFPRALDMEMFYAQMHAIRKDKGLADDYHIIITKDAETDKVEFELLKVKPSAMSTETLQHRILKLIDPAYKSRLRELEDYNSEK